jgi:hypothetical protein
MVKSLGDYNKEKSSSSDTKNIKWSKKNPVEKVERIFKVEEDLDEDKSKNQTLNRRFEKSSVSNSKIGPGYKRKAR